MTYVPTESDLPFVRMGGEPGVRAVAARFYDVMDADEPALARLHPLDDAGKVSPNARERFALFLVEWTGGPPVFSSVHGHPRLRMRHGHVPVDVAMRDAWLRCMKRALEDSELDAGVADFLMERFAHLGDHMRNVRE